MKTNLQPTTYPPSLARMGPESLDLQLPWITRGAIDQLVQVLDSDDVVLDLGTGGSTLFYANRCRQVLGLETESGWFHRVLERTSGLPNVVLRRTLTRPQVSAEDQVQELIARTAGSFDVISIDTMSPLRRDVLLAALKGNWTGGVLVLDNFTDHLMWQQLADLTGDQLLRVLGKQATHVVVDHLDSEWVGAGTRLVIDRSRLE